MYAYLLYTNREDIINYEKFVGPGDVSTSSAMTNIMDDTPLPSPSAQYVRAREIKFLHKAYEGRRWYWEVVETIRRLQLTALLSVVTVGTASHILNTPHLLHHSIADWLYLACCSLPPNGCVLLSVLPVVQP